MKLSQLFNLKSIEAFCDSANARGFTDSKPGIILGRMLTAVDPTIYEQKFPELAFMNAGFEVDNSGGYADYIQSLQVRVEGSFAEQGDTSGAKGMISLAGKDSILPVTGWSAHSKWSDDDIGRAELQGINLPQRLLEAHNEVYQQAIDKMIGDVALDYNKWGAADNTNHSAKTGKDLYDAFAAALSAQWSAVNNIPQYKANLIITSAKVYNRLATSLLSTTGDNASSPLATLKANFPGLEIMISALCDGIGSNGKDVALLVSTDGKAMKIRLPVPLTIGEIVKLNAFEFQVDSKYRIAGLDILQKNAGYMLRYV